MTDPRIKLGRDEAIVEMNVQTVQKLGMQSGMGKEEIDQLVEKIRNNTLKGEELNKLMNRARGLAAEENARRKLAQVKQSDKEKRDLRDNV